MEVTLSLYVNICFLYGNKYDLYIKYIQLIYATYMQSYMKTIWKSQTQYMRALIYQICTPAPSATPHTKYIHQYVISQYKPYTSYDSYKLHNILSVYHILWFK